MKGHCRKVYLAMDTATGDLCAVVFAFSDKGDSPILLRLLAQIPLSEQIGTVTGDGGATRSAAFQNRHGARRSFPSARTGNDGGRIAPPQLRATRSSARPNAWAEPPGIAGPGITPEVGSRRR